jgi:hypothetical protein
MLARYDAGDCSNTPKRHCENFVQSTPRGIRCECVCFFFCLVRLSVRHVALPIVPSNFPAPSTAVGMPEHLWDGALRRRKKGGGGARPGQGSVRPAKTGGFFRFRKIGFGKLVPSGRDGEARVIANDVMPGVVKIGATARDPEERLSEARATTWAPSCFRLVAQAAVDDAFAAEHAVHTLLAASSSRSRTTRPASSSTPSRRRRRAPRRYRRLRRRRRQWPRRRQRPRWRRRP